MRILLVSEFSGDESVYTYASSFAKSFDKGGHEVTTFNCKKNYLPVFGKMIYSIPYRLRFLSDYICNRNLKRVAAVYKPDTIFFLKADNISSNTIQFLKNSTGAHLINFYPDNPFVFWNGNSNSNVLNSLQYYDLFLTW